MSTILPVVTTVYTIVTAGAPSTSTPQEITLVDGCASIVLDTTGNSKPIFLVSSETSPGGQTDFSPSNSALVMMIPKETYIPVAFPRRSERPGINKWWVYGENNGDKLRVTQIVKVLR